MSFGSLEIARAFMPQPQEKQYPKHPVTDKILHHFSDGEKTVMELPEFVYEQIPSSQPRHDTNQYASETHFAKKVVELAANDPSLKDSAKPFETPPVAPSSFPASLTLVDFRAQKVAKAG